MAAMLLFERSLSVHLSIHVRRMENPGPSDTLLTVVDGSFGL
jgi:hypothetical protein